MTPEEANAKPEVGHIIRHKKTKLRAQVMNHFSDSEDYVQVILFPQPGVTGNTRFAKWHKDECERLRGNGPMTPDAKQEWKGMDGYTVWKLIEQRVNSDGESWSEIREMMHAWLRANGGTNE